MDWTMRTSRGELSGLKLRSWPKEARTGAASGAKACTSCSKKIRKGGWCKPPFIIDAPKPATESRIGSGHPGKPIFYVENQRANRMPAKSVPQETIDLIEITAARLHNRRKNKVPTWAMDEKPPECPWRRPSFCGADRG